MTAETKKFDCEITDTFAGEANYAWVRRAQIAVPKNATRRSIVIAAKKALAITGVRCTVYEYGDMIEIRLHKACLVAFITYHDD